MDDLLTKDQAKAQLRLDGDADDPWLDIWIPAISDAVRDWLKDRWRCYELERDADGNAVLGENGEPIIKLDDDGAPIVLKRVQGAALVELSSQYRFREGEGDNEVPASAGHGYTLCKGATAVLSTLRRPTVA
jgi:hypothetical protein